MQLPTTPASQARPASSASCWTPAEIAAYLRVDRETVYRDLKAKRLRGVRVRGAWRIRPEDLTAYLGLTEDGPA